MALSKKAFGVQGFTATKGALTKDAMEISKALEYLKHAPFKEGVVKKVLQRGSQPLVDELQQQYIKGDPTGMGGDIGIFIDVVPAKRRLDAVYIGPAKKISKGWKLWYIMNWGHAVVN